MKKIFFSILLFFVVTLLPVYSFAQEITLPLKAGQIGGGCKLTNSIDVNKEALGNFEKKFGAKVTSLRNDFFTFDGAKLQINYIKTTDSANALKIYNSLVKISGKYNYIALKDNTTIEIMSPSPKTKDKIVKLINPKKVHKNQ